MTLARSLLLSFAAAAALAGPAAAQDVDPRPPVDPAPADADPTPAIPLIVMGEPLETAAPDEPAIPQPWAPAPRDETGRTVYGLYLAGRAAISRGAGEEGAAWLAAAGGLAPEQPLLREQAFTSLLLAGDLNDAARLAPEAGAVPPAIGEAGRLVEAVQIFADGDARQALAQLRARPVGPPHARAAVFVRPWIAAAAGDWDEALAPVPGDAVGVDALLMRYHRARLLELRRRYDEAEAEFQALTARPDGQPLFRLGYGEFLERRGRREAAVALYQAAVDAGAADAPTRRALARASSRGRAPELEGVRAGAASALTTAAAIASGEGAREFAAVYIRLALNIEPSDTYRLLLGSTLADARLEAASRAALEQVGPGDPAAYAAARTQIAASLTREDRDLEALEEFRRAAAAAPDNPRIAYYLAGQLIQLERYAEALELLNSPVLNTAGQGPEVQFMRGAAYESLGRIPEAEAELWAALQARPDEPTFLNYLGYLWVDSGTRVAEGAAMIARAHAADPENGNIQDSLGWAQYRQGLYDAAVETLEAAVAKEPGNAEINDHLGDAYWKVGRRREAGFQWSRVLTLDPDQERRAGVERKLADGLDAVADGSGDPVGSRP